MGATEIYFTLCGLWYVVCGGVYLCGLVVSDVVPQHEQLLLQPLHRLRVLACKDTKRPQRES